jgi:FkbM family methyltransferase
LPGCFSELESANFGPNVSLFNVALSNTKGIAKFVFAQGTPQESGLRQRNYNNPELANPVQIEVMTARLDDLAVSLQRLDFIKIDAEGGEMLILEGATEALKRFRPILSVEYGRPSYSAYGNSAETLYRFAEKHSYIICDLFGAAIATLDTWRNVCDQTFWDWYLVPKDCVKAWQKSMKPLSDIDAVLQSIA